MKALIITYYWPPAGGSGVQRWLKFVKYLRDFGIEPVIYTPENPSYPILDETLSKEIPDNITILKHKIVEPNQFLNSNKKKQSGGFLDSKPTFTGRITQYIRANFFIPDARKYWVKPSVNYLQSYISEQSIDVVISTGPPHSMHLIGLELQKKTQVKWIADFRDPWTDIDYFHQLPLTKKSLQKHQQLELEVVSNADHVLVVGKSMKESYQKISSKVSVITNGFDDMKMSKQIKLDTKFSLVHVGLMNADRNPINLWNAIKELITEHKDFDKDVKIKLIGSISNEVTESLSQFDEGIVEKISYISHDKVRELQIQSQVLLLSINNTPASKGIVTGKIFEYLQAKRPILAVGPENGDAAEILKNTKAGVCFDYLKKDEIKNHILALYKEYKNESLVINSSTIKKYHRRELTKQLSEIIKETIVSS